MIFQHHTRRDFFRDLSYFPRKVGVLLAKNVARRSTVSRKCGLNQIVFQMTRSTGRNNDKPYWAHLHFSDKHERWCG